MAIAGWECMSESLWKSDISLKHLHNVYYRRRNGWEVLLTDSHVGRRSRQDWQALGLFMYHAQARPKWRARREVAWGLGYGWHARPSWHGRSCTRGSRTCEERSLPSATGVSAMLLAQLKFAWETLLTLIYLTLARLSLIDFVRIVYLHAMTSQPNIPSEYCTLSHLCCAVFFG